jgi:hypothetical protein
LPAVCTDFAVLAAWLWIGKLRETVNLLIYIWKSACDYCLLMALFCVLIHCVPCPKNCRRKWSCLMFSNPLCTTEPDGTIQVRLPVSRRYIFLCIGVVFHEYEVCYVNKVSGRVVLELVHTSKQNWKQITRDCIGSVFNLVRSHI